MEKRVVSKKYFFSVNIQINTCLAVCGYEDSTFNGTAFGLLVIQFKRFNEFKDFNCFLSTQCPR